MHRSISLLNRFLLVLIFATSTSQAQTITDGFGDADRNNDGMIGFYDTDVNLNDMFDPGELTTAEDASDVGIIWAATRGFTSSNTGDPKGNIKIVDDSAGLGSGYAMYYEAKGSGSSGAGFFGQPISIPPNVGDKIVVGFDFRINPESNNPTPPPANGQLRWGLFQDTDSELGMMGAAGRNGDTVTWGLDDGDWRAFEPGPEGDRGIWTRVPIGVLSDAGDSRNNYEYNLKDINGTTNNGRFLEGSGVNATAGMGGDVGTIASPTDDGPGQKIGGDLVSDPMNQIPVAPHSLRMEIERTADSLRVSSYVDGALSLSDEISTTSDSLAVLGPAPDSFDYFAMRNTNPSGGTGDWDFIIDNFSLTVIPEPGSLGLLIFASLGLLLGARRRG